MSPVPPAPTPDDDPVARATDALRRAPIPEGPSPETIARTLAALCAADEGTGPSSRPTRRIMLTILKAAAAALAAAAGVTYFTAPPPASATAEFVEAAQKLQQARTLSFRQSITVSGVPLPMNARVLYKVPGLVRMEHELAGAGINVLDLIHGKSLLLFPDDRSAMVMDSPKARADEPDRRDPSAAMIEYMRDLARKNGEPAGEKVIGGVRAHGFRVKEEGQDLTVWVDPEKKLPLLVEFKGRSGNLDFHGSFAEIKLDPELDDALFRLDPPADYRLRRMNVKLDMTHEEAVATYLRHYTDASGGRFPARLDDLVDMQKVISAATKKKAQDQEAKARPKSIIDQLDPEIFEFAAATGRVVAFCQKMKGQYGYKPDGVKRGDAKAIVFWYRPEGREKYRVVYGDLHIGEAAEAELPAR